MAGKFDNAGVASITKLIRQQVASLDISESTKKLFLFILDNSSGYLAFARKYLQQKAKGSVNPVELMNAYLLSKGETLANFGVSVVDHEVLSDAWACMQLVLDVKDSAKYSEAGPLGVALTIGFLINDLGAFLVNFTPAQRAYYELFLNKASVSVTIAPPADVVPRQPGRRTIRCY